MMHHANNVTATSAELSASVDPEGAPTECYFEYGTTPALGGVAPCESSPGEGEEYVRVGAKVSGLDPAPPTSCASWRSTNRALRAAAKVKNTTSPPLRAVRPPVVTKIKPKKGPAGGEHGHDRRRTLRKRDAVYFGGTEAYDHTKSKWSKIEADRAARRRQSRHHGVTRSGTSADQQKRRLHLRQADHHQPDPERRAARGRHGSDRHRQRLRTGQHGTEVRIRQEQQRRRSNARPRPTAW